MTRAQAKEYTDQLCQAEDLIMKAMLDLEWVGALSPNLEKAFNIIQSLPEYESNELFIAYGCDPYGDDEWELGRSDTEIGAMKYAIDDYFKAVGEESFNDYTRDLNLPENWKEDENLVRAVFHAIGEEGYCIRSI